MKQYKKGLLCLMVLSAMSLMAADSKPIYVTTFDDEAGENSSHCSLREAIIAAQKNTSFGGCSAGRTGLGQTDVIELQAGAYLLTRGELSPESSVRILGKSRNNYEAKSAFTDAYPAYEEIKTVIASKNADSRLFNTAATRADVQLQDIALKNGYAKDYGGAVYAGGNFSIKRGAVTDSKAGKAGGAIYAVALDANKEINISSSRIENNAAPKGSVLAMSCLGNMKDNKPVISIAQSSIIRNGAPDSLSAMDFCGSIDAVLEANTIAENTADADEGSILRAVSDEIERLSPYSSLTFSSNTIVDNVAYSAFYYDSNAVKSLSYNVLAYNGAGKSCRYLNNQEPGDTVPIRAFNNALELENESCMLPAKALADAADSYKNLDVSNIAMYSLLTGLQNASVYNQYLPLYYPKAGTQGASLVNVGTSACSQYDQRGIARIADAALILSPDQRNSCDIGSVELLKFSAADSDTLNNPSQKKMLSDLQGVIDGFKADIADPDRQEYKTANQADLQAAELYLDKLKNNLIYRAIYIDPFVLALPQEVNAGSSEERKYKLLNAENYDVAVKAIGIGTELKVDSAGKPVLKGDAADLVCRWDSALNKILMYRTGGGATGLGQLAYCQYTLKEKAGSRAESSGILKGEFQNIAPIAVNDQYALSPENSLTVRVNPLENDSDGGDGPESQLPAGKALWHKNEDGKDIPIHFDSIPAGLDFKAQYSGPCPNGYEQDTCYGGTLEFAAKNNFSQFSYEVKYTVFDSEGKSSASADINLLNTAKDTNSSSSGGGSAGIFGILALAGLACFRMRKYAPRR